MSEKVILYKFDISPCCRAVSIVAHLIGLEIEERYRLLSHLQDFFLLIFLFRNVRNVNLFKGEHVKPEFLKVLHSFMSLNTKNSIIFLFPSVESRTYRPDNR